MKFSLDSGSHGHVIRGYGPDFVQVDDLRLTRSFILTPGSLQTDWPPSAIRDLCPQHCDPLLELDLEIVILGTGARQEFPDPGLFGRLHTARIGIEVMSTSAACRTYNIIRNEGRRVAAAIILPPLSRTALPPRTPPPP